MSGRLPAKPVLSVAYPNPATHAFAVPCLFLLSPPRFSQQSIALWCIPLPAALSPRSRQTTCPVRQVLRGFPRMPLDWTHETPTLLSGPTMASRQPGAPTRPLLVSDVTLQSTLDNRGIVRHSNSKP